MKIRVMLVDDHQMIREGLRALLDAESDIQIVAEASGGRQALELARIHTPDVVVMDIGMPDLNGVETTRQLRKELPRTRVVALSIHADRRYIHNMLEAGACGYVLKITAYDELLRAVRAAKLGRTYLSPEIAGFVVNRSVSPHPDGEPSAFSELGSRERQVLQLVAEGLTSGEIGTRLHISIKTVETHRRNLARKLGLHGTAELTKYAIREGLTSTDA